MSLAKKLTIAFLACGLLPTIVVGLVSYWSSSKGMGHIREEAAADLSQKAENQLIILRDTRKDQIEDFAATHRQNLDLLRENVTALQEEGFRKLSAVQELKSAQLVELFSRMRKDVTTLSQSVDVREIFGRLKAYHDEMGTQPDEPYDVSTEEYREIFESCRKYLSAFAQTQGYPNIYVVCAAHGHVMFSVQDGPDRGTNLGHGPFKESGLAHVWRGTRDTGGCAFDDFEPYAPAGNQPKAFISAPFTGDDGDVLGAIVLQIPGEHINAIVQRRAGMGTTGETYLVGEAHDRTEFRSDMLTMGDGKYVIGAEIHTEYIDEVLKSRKPLRSLYVDSAGKPVMVAADPLPVDGLNWACITKIDLEEIISPRAGSGNSDFIANLNNGFGYHDTFLIHRSGHCFYSVAHEVEYRTNLLSGPYKDTNLGRLVKQVFSTDASGFADVEPYSPSNNEPTCFLAGPVAYSGKTELLVAVQLPIKMINRIMTAQTGMGDTGETILVGPDYLMRSDSRRDPNSHSVTASFANPEKGKVETDATRAVMEKAETGIVRGMTDYVGNKVLIAYTPVNVFGVTWCLNAKIDEAEAFAAVAEMEESAGSAVAGLVTWTSGLGIASAALICVFALLLSRSISRPIAHVISGLRDGANQVTDASGQVAGAAQSLAAGASEQASAIEETSSALEQMAAMTRNNAANSQKANELAAQARMNADQGNQTMNRLSEAMEAINTSSSEISKIIKVIEEIAFQTNLLALNAAVEAARAGEHGKGFAVVAEEVRNLAQRCAEAARNTTNLIGESVNRAHEGSAVAESAVGALESIVGDVSQVADLLSGITQASREQAQGVDQINTAVSQMDKVTQQNAAGAEESASAAEQLSAQAETVKNMVAQLAAVVAGTKMKASDGTPAPRRAARPEKLTSSRPTRKPASEPAAAHMSPHFSNANHAGTDDDLTHF